MNTHHTDSMSILMCSLTVVGTWIHNITQSHIITALTILSGITSVVYNVVKISREIKKKQ